MSAFGAGLALALVTLASTLHADPSMRAAPVLLASAVMGAVVGLLSDRLISRRGGRLLASLAYGSAVVAGHLAGRLGPF